MRCEIVLLGGDSLIYDDVTDFYLSYCYIFIFKEDKLIKDVYIKDVFNFFVYDTK